MYKLNLKNNTKSKKKELSEIILNIYNLILLNANSKNIIENKKQLFVNIKKKIGRKARDVNSRISPSIYQNTRA